MLQVEAMHAEGTMKQKVKLAFKFYVCSYASVFFSFDTFIFNLNQR